VIFLIKSVASTQRAIITVKTKMTSKVISVYENTQKLGAELAKNLSELANDVLAEGGNAVFKIGLSGKYKVSSLLTNIMDESI